VAGVVLAVAVVLLAGRERLRLPSSIDDDTVVAQLGPASTPFPVELRAAILGIRERPDDPVAAVAAARAYLEFGRSIGDARFAGAALGVLDPWLKLRTGEILNLAASARQYGHDFPGAVELLDLATAKDPRDAQALLSRANIRVVQGMYGEAEEDCRNLARAQRADLAILCDTTTKALLAEAPDAYVRLERMVAVKAIDPALLGYAHSLLGEMARFLDLPEKAGPHFEAARAADPRDLRTRMIYADFLLARGRPRDALAQLADAPLIDSIMVRQAIAYRALGNSTEVERLAGLLAPRFEEQAKLGGSSHAREAARFLLDVMDKPDAALAAARANWASQRELEDALLLVASARAAGKPGDAQPVFDWAAKEGVVSPMYLAAVGKAP
jgi:tetratricopeptide (TPR) repeat protein